MEHRCSIRVPSEIDAVVNCRKVGVVHATVRDVSLGGLFVETGPMRLRLNTPVNVIVRVAENGAARLYRLRAWVVWTGPYGAGLTLRSFDDATNVVLRMLVSRSSRSIIRSTRSDLLTHSRIGKPGLGREAKRHSG